MRHPNEGVLRRLVDEPVGVVDAAREHVAACPRCAESVASMRDDAALVGAALASRAEVDVDAAWGRLAGAGAHAGVAVLPATAGVRARRRTLRRPVIAAIGALAVLNVGAVAAANGWLEIFRTERVEPVSIGAADLSALPDLSGYGDFRMTAAPEVHPVSDAAAAAAETRLEVPRVTTLPRGVSGDPEYQVGREASASFKFSTERAAQTAARFGRALPPPPPGLDGSELRLVAGPGLAAIWSQPSGIPSLVVGRAVAPRAFSSADLPFETVRQYLLSLPGLPADTAAQLRGFNGARSTLPLPVPRDRVTTRSSEVRGVPATVVVTRDRTMAAVVWVHDGVVTAVAGAVDDDEVLSVARGLR